MRRAAKVDGNQAEIVAALRKVGATVQPLHTVGQGCVDLLVGYRASNFLIECKLPKEGLNVMQRVWFEGWKGQACVAHSAEEALRSIGAVSYALSGKALKEWNEECRQVAEYYRRKR